MMRKSPWKLLCLWSIAWVVAFATSPADRLRELNAQALQAQASLQEGGAEQALLSPAAADVLKQRFNALRELIQQNPDDALLVAFSPDLLDTLTKSVPYGAAYLETHGNWKAPVEYLIADGQNFVGYSTVVRMKLNDDFVYLHFAGTSPPQFQSGDILSVRGVRAGDRIAVEEVQKITPLGAASTTGAQNIVVILANLKSYRLPSDVTPSFVKGIMLGNSGGGTQSTPDYSVDDLWLQNSDGQAWVNRGGAGALKVSGPYNLPDDYNRAGACDYDSLIQAASATANPLVNFQDFSRIVVITPPNDACNWSSMGTVGSLPSYCPGDGACNYSWAMLRADGLIDRTSGVMSAAHVLGHNLTLHHSSSRDFGGEVIGPLGVAGTLDEYGDKSATMGAWQPGFYNADHAISQLGWLKPNTGYLDVSTSGSYSIRAYGTRPAGLKALRIQRGAPGDNAKFIVEFRQDRGTYDPTLAAAPAGRGALIHYRDGSTGDHTHLLDFTPNSGSSDFDDAALAVGRSWTDPYTNTTLKVDSIVNDMLNLTVTYGPVPCTRANPAVEMSRSNPSTLAGSDTTYTITVWNKDSQGCSPATFSLSSAPPSGWPAGTFSPQQLTIIPGGVAAATLTQTPPAGTAIGTYVVDTEARNIAANVNGIGSAGCTVIPPSAISPGITNNSSSVTAVLAGGKALLGANVAPRAGAGDVLQVLDTNLDRPTIHTLGLQVLIAGDENRNARIAVRYRSPGGTWRSAMDLFRAHPLVDWSFVLPPQFNGSIFDLLPGNTYELELHATDPDGNVDLTWTVTGRTRALPRREPAAPRVVPVTSASTFNSALADAQAGDIILMAPGTYNGPFKMTASGTAENPIVIRGQTANQVIIDGGGCRKTCQALLPDGSNSKDCCNALELTGDHLHVESLTIRNVERALSFEGSGLTDVVATRVVARDVDHGIASGPGDDGYFCDNDLEGRLVWPWVFDPNPNQYWDRRGIDVTGDGHVICYNRLKGFGDPVVNKKFRSRGWDAYGNDIIDTWDGTELDEAEANARLYLNRFTNVQAPISIQPAYGGPLYAIRNVALNASQEQIKLKGYGPINDIYYEPSGALILHNTLVSPRRALSIGASIVQYNSFFENNLFVGPTQLPVDGRTVTWDVRIYGIRFDYNGYYPNGKFYFRSFDGVALPIFASFLALQKSGLFEQHGLLLTTPIFEKGFVGPADKRKPALPGDFKLAANSNALDRGKPLPGINSNFMGTAPDLGAIERGCPAPLYGPRPPAQEQYVAAIDCRLGDTAKPTVAIVSPAPNATVSGVVTVRANATDNIGVARVEFFIDGGLAATDNTAAYEFQWNTAGVPNGNHTLQAKAFDEAGNSETSAPVQVTVSNVAGLNPALFVVGSTPLTAPDKALSNRLTALGFTVTVAKSATVTAAAAAGKMLVVLSDSVAPTSVNTKFKAVAKPVLVLEPNLFDDMAMTGKVAGTDYGTRGAQTQVAVSGTHPLAAGLAGKLTVVTAASAFNWGKPGASAAIGARAAVGTQATSFGYEAGSLMVGYTAPGRRVGLFIGTTPSTRLNANGWKLFDAAVRWAAGL